MYRQRRQSSQTEMARLNTLQQSLPFLIFSTILYFSGSLSFPGSQINPDCGTWDTLVPVEDSRFSVETFNSGSGENCHGAVKISNETDHAGFGGYSFEISSLLENAVIDWGNAGNPDGTVLITPPLSVELHAEPIDLSNDAQINLTAEITIASFGIDLRLFLFRTGLALIPGGNCLISEEQLLFAALRTADITTYFIELSLSGDFIGARLEFTRIGERLFLRLGEVLAEAGVECAIDLVKTLLKKPLVAIAKIGVAYLSWVPVFIYDYFKYEGKPVHIQFNYDALQSQTVIRYFQVTNIEPGDTLKVRSGPGIDHPSVGAIPRNGKYILAVGEPQQVGSADWIQIRYNGFEGWVNVSYLQPLITDFITIGEVDSSFTWTANNSLFPAYHDCLYNAANKGDCVRTLMNANGAPSNAVAFAELMDWEVYISEFQELGKVDRVTLIYPGRANGNFQNALVNGTPDLIHVDEFWVFNFAGSPQYETLQGQNPNIILWGWSGIYEGIEASPYGGQRFIVRFPLVDGCNACPHLGNTWIGFDFDQSGSFMGAAPVRVE